MNVDCIYLVHGFASAPKYPSDKASVLEEVFELPVKQLAYNSGGSFSVNMALLQSQVHEPPLFFIGTSLGGFYASKLAEFFYAQHTCMPIMLNPCHNPANVLKTSIGQHTNFATGETFTLSEQAVNSYRDITFIDPSQTMPRWILLNMDDALIDAHQTQALYKNKLEVITFQTGGHRFENIGSDEVREALQRINTCYFLCGVAND